MAYSLQHTGAQLDDAISKVLNNYVNTSDADATSDDIVAGKTAYVGGVKLVGTHECDGGGSSGGIVYGKGEYRVRFFDYDGTLLRENWIDKGGSVTPPEVTAINGFTFQGWNYTLSELSNIQGDLDVGAIVIPSDGKTILKVRLCNATGLTLPLYFTKSDASEMSIDWGDGTVTTHTNTGNFYTDHTYVGGNYTIKIWISSGSGTYYLGQSTMSITGSSQGYLDSLIEMNVGANVTRITYAGVNCHFLTYVSIPNGVEVAENTFQSCYSLVHVSFPKNITINGNTVRNCYGLRSVSFPTSITTYFQYQFAYCYSLQSVSFTNITTLNSYIVQSAHSLSRIDVNPNVTTLPAYTFTTATTVKTYVFHSTTPPIMSSSNTFGSIATGTKIYVPDESVSAYKAATNWTTVANYILPISYLPSDRDGDGVQIATDDTSLPSTGDYLVRFFDYDGTILKQQWVNDGNAATPPSDPIRDGLTFQGWSRQYSNITCDTDIGAMYGTSDGKTHLVVHLSHTSYLTLPVNVYKSDASTLSIDWGDGNTSTYTASGQINATHTYASTGIYTVKIWISSGSGGYTLSNYVVSSTQAYCNTLMAVHVGNNCQQIGAYAFYSCYCLRAVTLPNTITNIDVSAFYRCYALDTIIVPNGVTSIGNEAFRGCYSASNIILPTSISTIGTSVCRDCYSLSKIMIPSGITTINDYAFYTCRAIHEFDFPSSITYVGASAFQACEGTMQYVFRSTTPPTLSNTSAFSGINASCKIYVPDASIDAYKTATNWSTYANYMFPLSTLEG